MKSNINQVRLGAFLSYINMAIGSLIPMFYTPIMLQLLGQDEYGLFKLSNSVTSYLSLISFGIGSAVVRYLTKYRTERDKEGEQNIFGLFNIIFMVISLLTVFVGVVITFSLGSIYGNSITGEGQIFELKILVLILSLTTSLNFFCTPYNAVVTSHERFLFLQIINILTTIVTPIVNIMALYMGFKSIGMVVSSFSISIVIQIVYIIYVRKSIGIRPKYNNIPKHLIKEILVFSFWIFIANVVSQLYNTTDTLIIGAIPSLATVGVAIYNIGITFNNMLGNFSTGLLSVLTPKVNMMVFSNKSNSELTDLMIRVGRIQCYIVTLISTGFISFGRPFIKLWAGVGYEEAYWVAIVTMIPICIPLVQSTATNIIIAQNKHRFRSMVYLFIAILNVFGTIGCVRYFGIIGASLVTGISNLLGQGLLMNWYYYKKIHLDIFRFWKSVINIFIGPIVMCIVSLVLSIYINFYSWLTLSVGIIVYVILFLMYNWFFIMNDYEKDIFLKPIVKIFNKIKGSMIKSK